MWYYKTPVCTFWIRFDPPGRGGFLLGADDVELARYFSPEAAADDVFLCRTGFPPWDASDPADRPDSLTDWTRIDCRDWHPERDSGPAKGS